MSKCWAHSLGDCSGGMSGEHVFSNSIFKAGCSCPILITGVKRIRQGQPTRGAEKSNVLCRHHNSTLSPLDSVIGAIARFEAQVNNESFTDPLFIEGELLERWLLKTLVNVSAAGWISADKPHPSDNIVRMIFGREPVPDKIGLYSVKGRDPEHRPAGGVGFTPLLMSTPKGSRLAGAYITIHGMPLLASLHPMLAEMMEAGHAPTLMKKFSAEGLRHLYHPGAIVISRNRGAPVFIGLSWGGLLRFRDGSTATFPRPPQTGPA